MVGWVPSWGCVRGNLFSHTDVSLPLFLPPFLSLKINKILEKKKKTSSPTGEACERQHGGTWGGGTRGLSRSRTHTASSLLLCSGVRCVVCLFGAPEAQGCCGGYCDGEEEKSGQASPSALPPLWAENCSHLPALQRGRVTTSRAAILPALRTGAQRDQAAPPQPHGEEPRRFPERALQHSRRCLSPTVFARVSDGTCPFSGSAP
ncbi:hypothetical protein HJG60_009665 [Phyllostomus discolor]|uniref:Uncharacterized protein n=1 Tax=Phyllostomus discolor TaxID=89673 RepID=A0A834B7Z7_9CHIR|nr:hypothetical protein HJG60_009665 [Phyllostomus discolor]